MREFSGGIFNAYNSVEWVAFQNGADLSNLSLGAIQSFAQQVSHFDAALKGQIASAGSISKLQNLVNFDVTSQELAARGQERIDYNVRVGQSETREGKIFANLSVPLGNDLELYGFGGLSYRRGESGCFYRLPSQSRTTTSIYINGTVPKINSNIHDQSFAGGIRGKIGEWNLDFSNVWGNNTFNFFISDTHNATIGSSSPTTFDAGGHQFIQKTSNFDISQYFNNISSIGGINVAFGAEYRFENYKIDPGTEQSYGNYDQNGILVNSTTPNEALTTDFFGNTRPSGAQCFAGFLTTNEVDAIRSSFASYIDIEIDFSEDFLIGAAGRFEEYSDFGSTFNYKIASRYRISENVNLRGAMSTGFRAPSLHQIHFSRTSTIFTLVDGVSVAQEVGVFANTSRAAKLLGIPELKEETSQSFSLGLTTLFPEANLKLTIDGYLVNIDDRVVLTGQFGPGSGAELQSIFDQAGATGAAFFANAIDTKSRGLDIVVSHSTMIANEHILRNDLAATFSKTEWDQEAGINASDLLREKGLIGTYFDQTSRLYLEQAVPRTKITLSHLLSLDKFEFFLRNTLFGETTEATSAAIFDSDLNLIDNSIDPYNAGKVVTDITVSWKPIADLQFSIGANNLLDVFPDEADPTFQSSGRFVYSKRSPQFSYGGRFLFARLAFTLK
jgi:iron complex outermembrane receptor protein